MYITIRYLPHSNSCTWTLDVYMFYIIYVIYRYFVGWMESWLLKTASGDMLVQTV